MTTASSPDPTEPPDPADPPDPPLPEFVDEPIVPLCLRLPDRICFTLYHPGWYGLDNEQESQAFIGVAGETVYGFPDLDGLVAYVQTGHVRGLATGPDLDAVEAWTMDDFRDRLCDYDLVEMPELVDGELTQEDQVSIGSTLALGLDLLDFLEISDRHSNALRRDDDIAKLAAGDEVLSIFVPGRHRRHVVRMITNHWAPCMAKIAPRITTPAPASEQ